MLRVLTMLLGCCLLAAGVGETAVGAPASFGYQATVLSTQGDLPESSGLSVNPGDNLTGFFTFEPAMLPPLSNPLEQQDYFNVQPYTVEVAIDGNTFGTSAARPGVEYGASKNVVVLDDPLRRTALSLFMSFRPSDSDREIRVLLEFDPDSSVAKAPSE